MGLRSRFLSTVLGDLPQHDSRLSETSNPKRWDQLLGGKLGPGRWGRFETGYGTTCGVAANGWLISAGAPPEMIDAATPEGSGWTPGAHISRINQGAKALGWLHEPVRGQLPTFRPGDLYEINHTTSDGSDGTHIGVVLSVTPSADGKSLTAETAEGGQGTRQAQYAGRNTRTFSLSDGPHAVVVQSPSGAAWLDRWVALGGDEDGDLGSGGGDEEIPSTKPEGAGGDGALILGLAGGGLLLLGAVWASTYAPVPPPAQFYAVTLALPPHVERRLAEELGGR